MAFETISIDYELKKRMEQMKGDRSWNDFLKDLLNENDQLD